MKTIPYDLLMDLLYDLFYQECAIKDIDCDGRVEFHHVFTYQGRQIQEKWAIMLLCNFHHRLAREKKYQERIEYLSLLRATDEDLKKYNYSFLKQKKNYLTKKYGEQKNPIDQRES